MRPMNRTRRRTAERLMISTCIIHRVTTTEDPDDGTTSNQTVEVYRGKCKVQSQRPYESVINSAGRPMVMQRVELHVPVGTGPFRIGDIAEVIDTGQTVRIGGVDTKTLQTAQRLLVDENTNAEVPSG